MCDLSGSRISCKRSKLEENDFYLHNLVINPTHENKIAIKFMIKNIDGDESTSTDSKLSKFNPVRFPFLSEASNLEYDTRSQGTVEIAEPNNCEECCALQIFERLDLNKVFNTEFFDSVIQRNNYVHLNGIQYELLLKESSMIIRILKKHEIGCGFVGVGFYPGIMLPGVLLGIMEAGYGFYPLDYKRPISDIFQARSILKLDWIIVDASYLRSHIIKESNKEIVLCHQININLNNDNFVCFLIKLQQNFPTAKISSDAFSPYNYAYAMRTSGTTGNRRLVLVPHKAIVLNVLDFSRIFKVSSQDVVLSIAPVTFDPSIIDLFVALNAGATVIYMADDIRLNPTEVAKIIIEQKVTILQCTPSFLLRFEKTLLQSTVFHPFNSQLRILALGGEKCLNKSYLREIIIPAKQQSLEIFNLYGVTEVSCWASISVIKLSAATGTTWDLDDISIGNPLSSTALQLFPAPMSKSENCESEGEMLIGYELVRECSVYSEKYGTIIKPFQLDFENNDKYSLGKKYKFFQTGDYMSKVTQTCPETGEKVINYFFVNRTDRIWKRNGVKVDLEEIEKIALATSPSLFSLAICLEYNQLILLILKLEVNQLDRHNITSQLHSNLKSKLYFESHPDRIIFLNSNHDLPINTNGKLDVQRILNATTDTDKRNFIVDSKSGSDTIHSIFEPVTTKSYAIGEIQFEQIFNTLWNFNTQHIPAPVPSNSTNDCFLACGGNSISANRFVEEFFDRIGKFGSALHIQNEKFLISQLLGQAYTDVKADFCEIAKKSSYHCKFGIFRGNSAGDDLCTNYCQELQNCATNTNFGRTTGENCDTKYRNLTKGCSLKSSPECTVGSTLAFPIGLCVDATPVLAPHPIHGQICIIGSHSGSVYAFSMPELARLLLSSRDSTWNSTYCPKEVVSEEAAAGGVGKLPALVWHKFLPDRIESTITLQSGQNSGYFGYLGCHDRRLYKISTINGNIEWSFYSDSEIRSSPAISQDGTCVIFSTPYIVHCIDSNSGTIRWTKRSYSYILQTYSAVVSATSVFLSTVDGILALLLNDGKVLWRSANKGICTTPLLVEKKNILVFGDRSGLIFALDQVTGKDEWNSGAHNKRAQDGENASPPNYLVYHECESLRSHVDCSGYIIYSTHDGTIVGLDTSSGQELLRTSIGKECRSKPLLFDITVDETNVVDFDSTLEPGPSSSAADESGSRELTRRGQRRCSCCCLINSQDGSMFVLEWSSLECGMTQADKDNNCINNVTRELFRFGQDGAQSFSCPMFDFHHNILAVGSRDNCVHFAMLS